MKKFLSMVLALTLLMSSLTALAAVVNPVPYPETGVVFSDDFEDYKVSGGKGASVQVTAGHALRTNWNYNNNCWVLNNGEDNTSAYWGDIWYQLPSGATGVSSGVLEYSFDLYMFSTGITKGDLYMAIWKTTADKSFFPVTASVDSKDPTKMNIYFGTGDNRGARPSSETDHTLVTTNTDVWHNIKMRVDFENKTIDYYLDGNLAASHRGNDTNSAPTSECTLTGYVGLCQTEATYIYVDNVKFERFVETPDPEPVDENLLLSEDFEDYKFYGKQTYVRVGGSNSQDAYAKAAGDLFKSKWNNTDADLAYNGTDYIGYVNKEASTSNKYYYWGNKINYVRPTDKAVISSGKLELSFRTYIPAIIPENHGVYLQMHTNTNGWFMPFIAKRTADGVSIFCGTGDNFTNPYAPDKQHGTEIKTTVGWHKLKAVFDFDERKIVYTIDDDTTVEHRDNAIGVAALSKCNLDWGFYVRMVDTATENANTVYNLIENTEIGVDDFVLRKIPTQTVNKELKIMNGASELDVAAITGTETLTVTFDAPAAVNGKKANVIIASYVGEELTGIVCDTDKTVNAGTNSFDLTINDKFAGANTVKAFIFTNFDEMYPLTDAAVYTK